MWLNYFYSSYLYILNKIRLIYTIKYVKILLYFKYIEAYKFILGGFRMDRQLLQDVLKEALKKEQFGIIIWANSTIFDSLASKLSPKSELYNHILEKVSKGDQMQLYADWNGFPMPGLIIIPVQKMLSYGSLFDYILYLCEKGHYDGPFTFIPSNELSEFP